MKIYHNPKCSNSRGALEILQKHNAEYECIEYLVSGISREEISEIIEKLHLTPIAIVRQTEDVWKERYAGTVMSETQIVDALVENPILLQRPIIVTDTFAVIARPPESLEVIFM